MTIPTQRLQEARAGLEAILLNTAILSPDGVSPVNAAISALSQAEADLAGARAALEPLANLAADEDSAGVNMGDPLGKWFSVANLADAWNVFHGPPSNLDRKGT